MNVICDRKKHHKHKHKKHKNEQEANGQGGLDVSTTRLNSSPSSSSKFQSTHISILVDGEIDDTNLDLEDLERQKALLQARLAYESDESNSVDVVDARAVANSSMGLILQGYGTSDDDCEVVKIIEKDESKVSRLNKSNRGHGKNVEHRQDHRRSNENTHERRENSRDLNFVSKTRSSTTASPPGRRRMEQEAESREHGNERRSSPSSGIGSRPKNNSGNDESRYSLNYSIHMSHSSSHRTRGGGNDKDQRRSSSLTPSAALHSGTLGEGREARENKENRAPPPPSRESQKSSSSSSRDRRGEVIEGNDYEARSSGQSHSSRKRSESPHERRHSTDREYSSTTHVSRRSSRSPQHTSSSSSRYHNFPTSSSSSALKRHSPSQGHRSRDQDKYFYNSSGRHSSQDRGRWISHSRGRSPDDRHYVSGSRTNQRFPRGRSVAGLIRVGILY